MSFGLNIYNIPIDYILVKCKTFDGSKNIYISLILILVP